MKIANSDSHGHFVQNLTLWGCSQRQAATKIFLELPWTAMGIGFRQKSILVMVKKLVKSRVS